jgi:recombination protein RecA
VENNISPTPVAQEQVPTEEPVKGKKGKKADKEKDVVADIIGPEQLETFNKELLKEFGQKITAGVEFLDKNLKSISTGSMKLDLALKCPFIEGSVVEYYGENQVGKTTLALEVAANAIAMGKPVFYFDLERKLREAQINMINRLDKKLFTVIRPDTGEEAVNMITKCVKQIPGCFVVFDSLSALLPEVEDAEGGEKQTMGVVARLAWKLVRKVLGPAERNKCTILFISHITANLNPYASGDTTKGGKAIPDMAAQRVKLTRRMAELIKDADGNAIGQVISCKIIKNNVNRPFIEVDVPIIYGRGIDRVADLFGAACDFGIIDTSTKGWYNINGKNMRESEVKELIENDKPFRDELRKKIRDIFEE